MTLLWAALAGVVVGIILGALGGGGAIITVPILIYGLGMSPAQGTAGSLVIVGTSSLVAAVTHHRNGNVAWAQGTIFAAIGTLGTVLGSVVSRGLDPVWLMLAFGTLLVLVATLMLRKALSRTPARTSVRHSLREPRTLALTLLTATVVGLLTGFFGVGGGFAIVPALTLVLGFGMPLAVGTSLVVIALNSATALATKLTIGVDLDWPPILAFTATAMLASVLGARIGTRANPKTLQKAFAALLLVVAAYTLVTNGLALAS